MSELINSDVFLVKEHYGLLKSANNFDVYSPETGDIIMECREPNLGFITKLLRFTDFKKYTPFDVQIRDSSGQPIVRIQRGISLWLSTVTVTDGENRVLGTFEQQLFSIGGRFKVLDANGHFLCDLSGNWVGWEFFFKNDDTTLAQVSKKWRGMGAEMLTSADNYVLEINPKVEHNSDVRKLILAAVMCIDMVLKE